MNEIFPNDVVFPCLKSILTYCSPFSSETEDRVIAATPNLRRIYMKRPIHFESFLKKLEKIPGRLEQLNEIMILPTEQLTSLIVENNLKLTYLSLFVFYVSKNDVQKILEKYAGNLEGLNIWHGHTTTEEELVIPPMPKLQVLSKFKNLLNLKLNKQLLVFFSFCIF